jgi:hypothetical protein
MRARTMDKWTKASGLSLLALGILCNFPAQSQTQQDTLTDRAEQGNDTQDP